jgi:hypothetical protein
MTVELALKRFLSHIGVYDNYPYGSAAKPPRSRTEGEGSISKDEPERDFA